MLKKLTLLFLLTILPSVRPFAQEQPVAEVFFGAELSYADVNFTRLYNTLINVTPGTKVHLGNEWEFDAQMFIPVVNKGYAPRNSMLRLNMANISKVLRFEDIHQYFKLTAGLFGKEQYGGDLRWMYPINSWLMVQGRLGLTNHWALGYHLEEETHESEFLTSNWNFTSQLGASIWLNPWNTELRATGGRYLNRDYGVEGEIVRHFKHCSVTIFAQYHDESYTEYVSQPYRYTGGFRIVMMIPPYNRTKKTPVDVRFASNFRLTYNAQSNGFSMRKYTTDPEENERTYPIRIPWGTGNFNE